MRNALVICLLLTLMAIACAQGMNADPEARALLERFNAMTVAGATVGDDFSTARERRLVGPITIATGRNADDKAAIYPETRDDAIHIYYGATIPRRGHLSLDCMLPPQRPKDHNFMTLLSAGTPGNTKFYVRVNGDLRPSVHILTKREGINLLGEPLSLGQWHHLEWWFGPEGSVLVVDDVIHDYSVDFSTPYAVEVGEAFWLGDQPWWDAGGRKGVFYPLDSFVGSISEFRLEGLK